MAFQSDYKVRNGYGCTLPSIVLYYHVTTLFNSSLSFLVIIIESQHLRTPGPDADDVHDRHPILRERLSPNDTCWKTEEYNVVEECDVCTRECCHVILLPRKLVFS